MIKDETFARDCSKLITVSFSWSNLCELNQRDDKELPLMYSKFKSNLKINVFRMRFITCSQCIRLLFAMCVSIWIHIKQTAATLDNNVIFLKITHQQFDFFLTSDKTHLLIIGSLWPYISLITKVANWKDVHYLIFTTVIHINLLL